MIPRFLRALAGAAVVAPILVGCDISPQPAPPGSQPGIDPQAITITQVDSASVEVRGTRAVGADAQLTLANLDVANADGATSADAEGSFAIVLPGQISDVLRVSATTSNDAAQADLTGTTSGGAAQIVEPAYEDCLVLAPELVDFGQIPLAAPIQQQDVILTNQCTGPLLIDSVSLRDGGDFVLLGPGPGQLPLSFDPGSQATVEVGFKTLTIGPYSDYVRVRFDSATGPRRFISLNAVSVP